MKRKFILMATFLASTALLLGFNARGHNYGLVEKISTAKVERKIGTKSANFKHDIAYNQSGKIFLELGADNWKRNDSKIVLYMYDKNSKNSHNAWGEMVAPSGTSKFVEYSFDLSFVPTHCYAFSLKSSVEPKDDWKYPSERESDDIFSTTQEIKFANVIWLGGYSNGGKFTTFDYYELDISVSGSTVTDDNNDPVPFQFEFEEVRVNDYDKLEVFGDVDLPEGTDFDVNGSYNFTTHPSISSQFELSSEQIHNTIAGVFSFNVCFDSIYFDVGSSLYVYVNLESYITTEAIEEADGFGKLFLTQTDGYCGAAISSDVQTSLKNAYEALIRDEGAAQIIFYSSEVKRGIFDPAGKKYGDDDYYMSAASEALSRYVDMQERGYTDFLGLSGNNPYHPAPLVSFENRIYSVAIIVIILSTTATITALGTIILLKKRKHF